MSMSLIEIPLGLTPYLLTKGQYRGMLQMLLNLDAR